LADGEEVGGGAEQRFERVAVLVVIAEVDCYLDARLPNDERIFVVDAVRTRLRGRLWRHGYLRGYWHAAASYWRNLLDRTNEAGLVQAEDNVRTDNRAKDIAGANELREVAP
jgi:hypothetical protein